ncbi:MAG: hypothetical protein AAF267_12400 [Deinococcota bacterium]
MYQFGRVLLFPYLLLVYASFAQVDDSIFRQPIEFEDFPGETRCMEAHATICGHNGFVCQTTGLDELFEDLGDIPNFNADAFVCNTSRPLSRGSIAETVTWLRVHQNNQIADLYMLSVGSFRSSSSTTPNMTDQCYRDAALLSFEALGESSYVYTKRNTYRGTRRVSSNPPKTMMAWRQSEKYLRIFSVVESNVLSTKEIPLADYETVEGSFEEFLDGQYVDEDAIENYEEWLARIATLPDQLTYTLDWPNTLTILVNPGTEPTEAQLEWVGVHDLSAAQP